MRAFWRLLLSVAGAAAVIVAGSAALFVTSAPKWVSVALEPFSLLLTPGVAVCMITMRMHDPTPWEILRGTFAFYVALVYGLLWWLNGRTSLARR